jgi:hypothetical protein
VILPKNQKADASHKYTKATDDYETPEHEEEDLYILRTDDVKAIS